MSNRKYEDVKEYWLYSIKVPSVNKYYIGVSKQKCHERWRKSLYKGKSLEPYLSEWDSMIKTLLVDNLTKEEALKYEDNIIQALKMNDLCINERRSGLIKISDENAYHKELKKTNTEYHERCKQRTKQWQENNPDYNKQWRENNREKYNEYMKQYNKQYRLKKKLEREQQQTVVD